MVANANILLREIMNGDTGAVHRRLMAGLSANTVIRGFSLLHWACQWGRLNIARLLLKVGAQVNKRDGHGFTPLHIAAGENRPKLAALLLKYGANPNAVAHADDNGTPLHKAAVFGGRTLISELLKGGGSIAKRDDLGRTPYHFAVRRKNKQVAEFLRGVDGN